MNRFFVFPVLAILASACQSAPDVQYKTVFGNTHAHCNYSGDIAKSKAKKGLQLDPKNTVDNHYRIAKENGYDFYCVTDHSQYPEYTLEAWADVKAKADAFTDDTFVGLRGYEHSENDGPDGHGHMNVYNSSMFLNALADSVSIEFFHNWLARPENDNVIAGFNHPAKDAYNDFHCYNEGARDNFKIIELINGSKPRFYPSFLNALSKGWKVSPVAGCDNHGWEGISKWPCRTGLLVTELSQDGVLDAMAHRRTYATLDKNLEISYTVNRKIMGSDIEKADKYRFDISVNEPDSGKEDQVITKIEIVTDGGEVVASSEFQDYNVEWRPVIEDTGKDYYFVLVYNASRQDGPIAFVAPVWIER